MSFIYAKKVKNLLFRHKNQCKAANKREQLGSTSVGLLQFSYKILHKIFCISIVIYNFKYIPGIKHTPCEFLKPLQLASG